MERGAAEATSGRLSAAAASPRSRASGCSPSSRRESFNLSPKIVSSEDPSLAVKKKKPVPVLTRHQAKTLFSRLHKERERKTKSSADDPDETFKPKIGANSRKLGKAVHSRECQGLGRLEHLAKMGTEKLRNKKAKDDETMTLTTNSAPDSRTIDPSEFHIDPMGRTGKQGDRHVRALRHELDTREALEECTFKPKLSAATIEMAKNTPYLKHTTFYERGLAWAERRNRGLEASRKAKEDEAERECTFQPRIQNTVPEFMREIAQQQRMTRLAASTSENEWRRITDGPMDGADGAIAAAEARSARHVRASPPRRAANWQDSLGVPYDPRASSSGRAKSAPRLRSADDRWETPGDGVLAYGENEGLAMAGDIVLPTPPPRVHPGLRRRESGHVPIHSSTSHYKYKDLGVNEVDKLEDVRLAERPRTAAEKYSKHVDYFERLHMERTQRAREKEREKLDRLNRHNGSGWRNRVTKPVEFQFNRRPEHGEYRKVLKRPVSAKQTPGANLSNNLSNSVSSLQSFLAGEPEAGYRYTDFDDEKPPRSRDHHGKDVFGGYDESYERRGYGGEAQATDFWNEAPPRSGIEYYGGEDSDDEQFDRRLHARLRNHRNQFVTPDQVRSEGWY